MGMKAELMKGLKFGFWGAVVGAAATMVIGFNWGGWDTGGTVHKLTDQAVLNEQAGICAAQFLHQADHASEMAKFTKTDSWSRSDFIGKGGWDKMPGQDKATPNVAD